MISPFYIDRGATLFLDRDGVINKRIIGGYVRFPEELKLLPGVDRAIFLLGLWFERIIVVTNQQGIGKGLMTVEELNLVHGVLRKELVQRAAVIHEIHYCPDLANKIPNCRKPHPAMAFAAQVNDPAIDFSKSVMVGDTPSDIEFGKRLGMQTVYIGSDYPESKTLPNAVFPSLLEWTWSLKCRK